MNILILNWRDPKNPKSGGAEKLNMHILKPFLKKGDSVIWYARAVPGLPHKEKYEGITVVRFGNVFTNLFCWPFFYWSGKFGKVDFIIDSIHGTGYMSSIIAPKVPKKILICEVAQNIWDEMYPFPMNKVGKIWEKIMFWFYKNNKFWTISDSTKKDLVNFGIHKKNISVLPMGFDAVTLEKIPKKQRIPTALFVGRLAEMKGIKDAMRAVAKVNQNTRKKWELKIVGRGEPRYEKSLKNMVDRLGLKDRVIFLGYVNEKTKFEEMAKAWVLLVPSSREGWGMIVPEANSVGTIALGYSVQGLSDVFVQYAKENILVSKNYIDMYNTLAGIKTPVLVQNKPKPGWEKLYTFVLKSIE